jgi:hypothetical protein
MLKKLVFASILTIFAIGSAAAQTKVDKYLGTWKMISQPKNSKLNLITLNVSVADEMLKVEKITEYTVNDEDRSSTVIYSYKLNGGTSTSLPFQGVSASTYLRYRADGRLRLGYDWNTTTVSQDPLAFNSSTREYWSLSGDGKTLTIFYNSNRPSAEFVFAKQ